MQTKAVRTHHLLFSAFRQTVAFPAMLKQWLIFYLAENNFSEGNIFSHFQFLVSNYELYKCKQAHNDKTI